MAKYELIDVDNVTCDLCLNPATCNIYRLNMSCICLKCRDLDRIEYRYRYICGACLGKWLKSRELDS